MAAAPEKVAVLPELRQELKLERGGSGAAGEPAWLIVDPAQHRYVQINEDAYQLLSRWQAGGPYQALIDAVAHGFGQTIGPDDIAEFVRFLAANGFTVEPEAGGWQNYADQARRAEHGWLMWAVHNYLFIKLPLFRPEAALTRLLPYVAPLYTRTFFAIVAAFGLVGLYLVSRQFDVFRATFQHFFSWDGALTYAIALGIVKSAHELGHAFTALRFGCRVPSMGVCFLVMFPVLYTDVTDAWRLRSKRERLMIGAAGVAVELAIACLATFLWPFLAEGVLKSLAFSIATVGWVLSLAINLNPLMRFDGYYLFADALGVDNLQSRAFAMGRWKLREVLFGLGAEAPEALPGTTRRILVGYAWAIWVYRLVVFTGIAVLVYHMAFKLLGIVLFLIEIVYFIARPIASELMRWWTEGRAIRATGRSKLTAALALGAVVLLIIPWSTRVAVPAVLEAAEIAHVYPARAGVVAEVKVAAGNEVKAGDALVVLSSPDIEHQIKVTSRKLALVKLRLARRGSDEEDRTQSMVHEREAQSLSSELRGLEREREELTVRAPQAGVIAEFNPSVHAGRAVGRAEFIALIRGGDRLVARGYIAGRDVARIGPSAPGRFIADLPGWPEVNVSLRDIGTSGIQNIDMPELASVHSGPVAVRPQASDGGHRRLAPVEANYLATMTAEEGAIAPGYSVRGVVQLDGDAQSLALRAWRQVAAVLVRESGF
jgi:putative peptide zinc metalloprotease protein